MVWKKIGVRSCMLCVPIISRGTIGWFKSEPIGLFYGIIGMYLFLSGMKSDSLRMALT